MKLALDIETSLNHKKIWVCWTKELDTGVKHKWTDQEKLKAYLKDATLIIAHNGIGFDFHLLNKLWNTKITLKKSYDTLIVSRLLDPSKTIGHSLEAWGNELGFQKIPYSKIWEWVKGRRQEYDGECFDDPVLPLLDHYCEGDVELLVKLYHHLTKELKAKNFSDYSVELEHKVASIIAKQERNGFKLDLPYTTLLLADIQGKLDSIYEAMQQRWPPYEVERVSEKTGKQLKPMLVTFNPGSRQQIAEKLMELGWKPEKRTEKGSIIVDESVLSGVDIPEAKMIAEYLLLQKRISQIKQWLEAVKDDGRVHGKVITNGAVTGRATHSSPNMAQIPNTSSLYGKECRECWTVEEGNVQVGVDLSGIELRCLSHYMQDSSWQHELLEGDVHWKNTQAFGLVPMGTSKTESKEHKDARNLSKTLCYSVLYGAGPAKVGSVVGAGAKEGSKLINNFMKNTPSLDKLSKKVQKLAAKGYVPALDGRKVWVRSEHAALNSLLQSAGAIIAKQWLVCATEELNKQKIPYKLLAWVHDEVQLETPEQYGDTVGKIVVEAARKAGEILNFRCPVDAEYRTGRNWYDCH